MGKRLADTEGTLILQVGDMVRRNSGFTELSFIVPKFGALGIVVEVANKGKFCKVYWNATNEVKACISRYLERVA